MNAALKTTSGSEKRILEFDLSAELHHGVVVSNLAYAVAEELGLPHDPALCCIAPEIPRAMYTFG